MTREELLRYGKEYLHDLETACCKVEELHLNFVRESIKALEQEPRKRTMQLVIDNKKQKEFAHEITKKFSFEELALFMYENSCEYCKKQHNCMGNATPQDCAKNIRQKFEKAYFETGDKE